MKAVLSLLVAFLFAAAALAAEPDEALSDPLLEARARALDTQLRCVVCQSQSIAESDAPLAKDMRLIVRERIAAGGSDREVIAFLVDRYGDYVRLRPALQANTALLWLFPALVLVAGIAGGVFYVRRLAAAPAAPPLTAEEERALATLVEERPPS